MADNINYWLDCSFGRFFWPTVYTKAILCLAPAKLILSCSGAVGDFFDICLYKKWVREYEI